MDEETIDTRLPSQVTDDYWIYAERQQGSYPEATDEGSGKWMVFVTRDKIDSVWNTITDAIRQGKLGDEAKVSTARLNPMQQTKKNMSFASTPMTIEMWRM